MVGLMVFDYTQTYSFCLGLGRRLLFRVALVHLKYFDVLARDRLYLFG